MASIPNRLIELSRALRSGELPITNYLSHLESAFIEREPTVHAFVPEERRFERLRYQADALLRRFPNPATRPVLFGVPVGVKDIFHVEGFPTRAGSNVPPEVLRGPEAESVTRLKQAGALILGKTVTTEFAYFGPGPTRNPCHLEHTPGGSSSGSAAAVAAGLSPLTLGTQTIGSIVRPASFCGVVGFKPSYERISRRGVIPLSPSLDHVGVFADDVAGVTMAASVLCHHWETPILPSERPVLGIPEGPYLSNADEGMLAHFRETASRLAAAGYIIKSVAAMPDFDDLRSRHNLIVAAEAAHVHKTWFAQYGESYHPKTVELIRSGQTVTREQLLDARRGRERLRSALAELMGVHGVDVWIAPAAPGPAPHGLESTGNPVMNLPWTHAGLPALNLPSGHTADGLPLGLQLVGLWHGDEELLAWATEIEKVVSG